MKRILLSLLALLLLLNVGGVCAAEAQMETAPGLRLDMDDLGEDGDSENSFVVVYGEQPVYVPVTLLYHHEDGTTTRFRVTPQVLTITYQYRLNVDEMGYAGVVVIRDDAYPDIAVDDRSGIGLNVSYAKETLPPLARIDGVGNTYAVEIGGGSFTITYDAVIHYNLRNEITGRESVTVTRSYGYTQTGP